MTYPPGSSEYMRCTVASSMKGSFRYPAVDLTPSWIARSKKSCSCTQSSVATCTSIATHSSGWSHEQFITSVGKVMRS